MSLSSFSSFSMSRHGHFLASHRSFPVPSPGTVTGYGLAAAQLLRFRQQGVRLVVCVDELAASGGYMMACCAHKILISPFAAVGSIGVSHVNFWEFVGFCRILGSSWLQVGYRLAIECYRMQQKIVVGRVCMCLLSFWAWRNRRCALGQSVSKSPWIHGLFGALPLALGSVASPTPWSAWTGRGWRWSRPRRANGNEPSILSRRQPLKP